MHRLDALTETLPIFGVKLVSTSPNHLLLQRKGTKVLANNQNMSLTITLLALFDRSKPASTAGFNALVKICYLYVV